MKRRVMMLLALAGCSRGGPMPAPAAGPPQVAEQASGTRALLQAVSAVSDNVVWVSGHRATWARSVDGGATWQTGAMTGADSTLQFRDVHAVSASVAYLLSAGNGAASRIYKTTDAGASWQLQFLNRDTSAFYDCFDFWDADHGIAISDAVRGRMIIIATEDGGAHWNDISGSLPAALDGEGAFAASGTCLLTRGRSQVWIGTGAATGARVYHSADRGRSWSVVATPVVSGNASGVASVAFRDERHGLALGGRLGEPNDRSGAVARSEDGGATWTLVGRPSYAGPVFGASYVPGLGATVVAAAPGGLDYSTDDGATWTSLNTLAYWAVGFGGRTGWAVGPGGRITRISF